VTEQIETVEENVGQNIAAPGTLTSQNQARPWSFLELTKPRIVLLITFSGAASMIVASRFTAPMSPFLIAVLSFILASAGCNAVTCYIDRDIDAIMERTNKRPIPDGRIRPSRALAFGVVLIIGGLTFSWLLGLVIFIIGLAGVLDNIIVYSVIAKRKTAANVILGSFSGAAPVLIGWAIARGTIDLMGLIAASLVVLWIPNHIWNLALYYAEDYRKAGIPMLPAVVDMKKAARCIVSTVFLLITFSVIPFVLGFLGTTYLLVTMPFTILLAVGNLRLAFKPSKKLAWRMFKISSPYLFILFFAMMIDQLPSSLI
jgi:protoheme IX farnesyltransferase